MAGKNGLMLFVAIYKKEISVDHRARFFLYGWLYIRPAGLGEGSCAVNSVVKMHNSLKTSDIRRSDPILSGILKHVILINYVNALLVRACLLAKLREKTGSEHGV